MANKVGIRVQDEFGNVKGENDFAEFSRACLPLRTQDLAAYVRAQGAEVMDERKEPLVKQAWALYSAGAPAPASIKLSNEPVFGQHGITQGPPPEEMTLTEDEIEEAMGADTVVAAEDTTSENDA